MWLLKSSSIRSCNTTFNLDLYKADLRFVQSRPYFQLYRPISQFQHINDANIRVFTFHFLSSWVLHFKFQWGSSIENMRCWIGSLNRIRDCKLYSNLNIMTRTAPYAMCLIRMKRHEESSYSANNTGANIIGHTNKIFMHTHLWIWMSAMCQWMTVKYNKRLESWPTVSKLLPYAWQMTMLHSMNLMLNI